MEAWMFGDDFPAENFTATDATMLEGDGNSPPLVTDNNPQSSPTLVQLLGSLGTTARDLGTAAGKVKADVKGAKANFNTAYKNSSTGNSLGTWWQYASTTDKLMVGLAAAGILVVLLKK